MKQFLATLFLPLLLSPALHTAAYAQEAAIEIAAPATSHEHPGTAPQQREARRTAPAARNAAAETDEEQIVLLNPETNEWESEQPPQAAPRPRPLADLFLEGGYTWMTAITFCLIALLFAAWKAPRWVKEFGLLALILGILSMMAGFYSVADLIQASGYPVSFTLLCGGLRVGFIAPIYGMIVYALSLVVRIALKPRI